MPTVASLAIDLSLDINDLLAEEAAARASFSALARDVSNMGDAIDRTMARASMSMIGYAAIVDRVRGTVITDVAQMRAALDALEKPITIGFIVDDNPVKAEIAFIESLHPEIHAKVVVDNSGLSSAAMAMIPQQYTPNWVPYQNTGMIPYVPPQGASGGGGGSDAADAAAVANIAADLKGGGGSGYLRSLFGSFFAGGRGGGNNRGLLNLLMGGGGRGGPGIPGFFGWGGLRLPAMGSLLSFAGLGPEHFAMTGAGIAGTIGGGALGGGLLGLGAAAPLAVGMGSDAAAMKDAAGEVTSYQQKLDALNRAVAVYGAGSVQAAAAQYDLNQVTAAFTPQLLAAVQATNAAKTNLSNVWDAASAQAKVSANSIMQQFIGIGTHFAPAIAGAAQQNLGIINKDIQPLVGYLESPQVMGVFTDLENKFSAQLPSAIHAFTGAVQFLVPQIDWLANQVKGNLSTSIDNFVQKLNSPEGIAKFHYYATEFIGDFRLIRDIAATATEDVFLLFSKDAHTGQSILQFLDDMLHKVETYEKSVEGNSSLRTIFQVHKDEIMALLNLLPSLISPLSKIYMTIAPAATQTLTFFLIVIGDIAKVMASNPFGAWILGIGLIAAKLHVLAPILKALFGPLAPWFNQLFQYLTQASRGWLGVGAAATTAAEEEKTAATVGGISAETNAVENGVAGDIVNPLGKGSRLQGGIAGAMGAFAGMSIGQSVGGTAGGIIGGIGGGALTGLAVGGPMGAALGAASGAVMSIVPAVAGAISSIANFRSAVDQGGNAATSMYQGMQDLSKGNGGFLGIGGKQADIQTYVNGIASNLSGMGVSTAIAGGHWQKIVAGAGRAAITVNAWVPDLSTAQVDAKAVVDNWDSGKMISNVVKSQGDLTLFEGYMAQLAKEGVTGVPAIVKSLQELAAHQKATAADASELQKVSDLVGPMSATLQQQVLTYWHQTHDSIGGVAQAAQIMGQVTTTNAQQASLLEFAYQRGVHNVSALQAETDTLQQAQFKMLNPTVISMGLFHAMWVTGTTDAGKLASYQNAIQGVAGQIGPLTIKQMQLMYGYLANGSISADNFMNYLSSTNAPASTLVSIMNKAGIAGSSLPQILGTLYGNIANASRAAFNLGLYIDNQRGIIYRTSAGYLGSGAAEGGFFAGPMSGYPMILHGREFVVPEYKASPALRLMMQSAIKSSSIPQSVPLSGMGVSPVSPILTGGASSGPSKSVTIGNVNLIGSKATPEQLSNELAWLVNYGN